MEIQYLGHSAIKISLGGEQFLFDPFISQNPLNTTLLVEEISADYLLITHAHADHIGDSILLCRQNPDMHLISNHEIAVWAEKQGVIAPEGMNIGGFLTTEKGIKIRATSALHSSSFSDGTYGGNPIGFILEDQLSQKGVYIAGDTGVSIEMKILPEIARFQTAILPIGNRYTMGVEDALVAAQFLKIQRVIGVHFDTFPAITIDHKAAISLFKSKGIQLHLPKIGENFLF